MAKLKAETERELMPDFAFEDWPQFYAGQFWVSHFPKRLKGADFLAPPFIYFGEAKREGLLENFLPIETNFMSFYRTLIGEGPVLLDHFHGRNPFTGEYKIKRYTRYTKELERLIRRQVREQVKLGCFDGMYIPSMGARIWFNHDMTHVFFVDSPEREAPIKKLAEACNLHILK